MIPKTVHPALAVFSFALSGCAILSPELGPQSVSDSGADSIQAEVPVVAHMMSLDDSLRPAEFHELQLGDSVQLLIGKPLNSTDIQDGQLIAGVVESRTDQAITLINVVQTDSASSESGVPILNKVPYVSRMFKNTGIATMTTRVPGAVTLPASDVQAAAVLTPEAFERVTQGLPPRIGVDFDFETMGDFVNHDPAVSEFLMQQPNSGVARLAD